MRRLCVRERFKIFLIYPAFSARPLNRISRLLARNSYTGSYDKQLRGRDLENDAVKFLDIEPLISSFVANSARSDLILENQNSSRTIWAFEWEAAGLKEWVDERQEEPGFKRRENSSEEEEMMRWMGLLVKDSGVEMSEMCRMFMIWGGER